MNNKHHKTLKAVMQHPVKANIKWSDIESMLVALGADIEEHAGSRVCFSLNGVDAVFHRPHPRIEAGRGMVRSVQGFLKSAGVL